MEPKKRTLVLHNIEPHVADVAVVLAKELPLETLRKVHSGAAVLLEYVRSLLFGEDVDVRVLVLHRFLPTERAVVEAIARDVNAPGP